MLQEVVETVSRRADVHQNDPGVPATDSELITISSQPSTQGVPHVSFTEFNLLQNISNSSYKKSYKALWNKKGSDSEPQIVAVSVLPNCGEISEKVAAFDRLGRHEHLVSVLASTVTPENWTCLVTELAPLGSLDSVIIDYADKNACVTDEVLLKICIQVCSGMVHLGQHGLVHGNLAARNVLVFQFHPSLARHVVVKIADYGMNVCVWLYLWVNMYIYIYMCVYIYIYICICCACVSVWWRGYGT